jgi:2-oxoglutarate ferredoxin oxidoreductase subunit delta
MPKVIVNVRHCKGCRLCVAVCPKKALRMSAELDLRGMNTAEVVEGSQCSGCLNCTVICPDAAIEIADDEETAGVVRKRRVSPRGR